MGREEILGCIRLESLTSLFLPQSLMHFRMDVEGRSASSVSIIVGEKSFESVGNEAGFSEDFKNILTI